jgi:hypothetical protein
LHARLFLLEPDVRRGILQCKTTSPQQWDKWRGTVPLAYVLQTLCEMLVTDAEIGLLAVLIRSPSYPLHEFTSSATRRPSSAFWMPSAAWWDAWDRGEIAAPVDAAGIEAHAR